MSFLSYEYITINCSLQNYQSKLDYQKVVIIPSVRSDLTAASNNVAGFINGLPASPVYAYIDYTDGRTINMVVRNEMVISGLNFIQNSFALQGLANFPLSGSTFSQLDGTTQQMILNSSFPVFLFVPNPLSDLAFIINMIG